METFSEDVFEFWEARILGGDEGVEFGSEERRWKTSLRMCLSFGRSEETLCKDEFDFL